MEGDGLTGLCGRIGAELDKMDEQRGRWMGRRRTTGETALRAVADARLRARECIGRERGVEGTVGTKSVGTQRRHPFDNPAGPVHSFRVTCVSPLIAPPGPVQFLLLLPQTSLFSSPVHSSHTPSSTW